MNKSSLTFNSFFKFPLMILLVATSSSTVYLLSTNSSLQKANQTLIKESQTLQKSIELVEEQNRDLIENLQTENENLESSFSVIKKENESLQNQLKKIGDDLSSATEEKTYLEEILINKTKEIENLKTSSSTSSSGSSGSSDNLAKKIKEKDEEIKKLNEQNNILSTKLGRLYKTTSDKITEINIAKITLEETIAEARKIIEKEWNTVDLGSITVQPGAGTKEKLSAQARKTAKKEGRVLAVNEDHGFVVVDIGKVDGIKNDTTLALNKNGQAVGTLAVLEIRDVMTACNIKDLMQGKKIEINDLVLIQR